MRLIQISIIMLCLVTVLFAQGTDTQISTIDDYNGWGWQSIVMENGLIKVATVPVIGARIMQYNLGEHSSIFVNPNELGETHAPNQSKWYNYGGYKVWPAPQSVWGWPPPAQLDAGVWTSNITDSTADSVAVFVKSPIEIWSNVRDIRMERRSVIYKGTSRVKVEQSIVNEGANNVSWSVWDITQCIVKHQGENDYENFWVYFPIKKENSVFGETGVKISASSDAWKGEVAPGVYGVQYLPEGKKIFADSPEGWIAYVDERDRYAYIKIFDIFEGEEYPDDGACNEVWINKDPNYLEVETLSPIWDIAPDGGKITFVENWYAVQMAGPILHANNVGAISKRLEYDPTTSMLSAVYGVFYEGRVKVVFFDSDSNVVCQGKNYDVTPMQEFVLQEELITPDNAKTVAVQVFNKSGVLIGSIESKSVAKLTRVDNRIIPPVSFTLRQNYPNPFNPNTTIEYRLDKKQFITLTVFDINGCEIETFVHGYKSVGVHKIVWNTTNIKTGVYLIRLQAEGQSATVKMILLK